MKYFKQSLSALLILMALYVVLFVHGTEAPTPEGSVVVDYWEKWTSEEAEQMFKVVDKFNQTVGKEKHIFVRCVSTAGIQQKTLVSAAAGVPPDITGLYQDDLMQFASLGALRPLDDLAAGRITADTYKKVFWDGCQLNGHLYGIVSAPAAVALLYNKRIMEQNAAALQAAGLDPSRPPRTMDELDAYAKALDIVMPDGRIDRTGFAPSLPGWYIINSYLWFGGDIWDPVHEKFTLTSPAVVRAFTWVQSFSKRLGGDSLASFAGGVGNFDSPQNEFMTGSVAMEEQGPWMATFIARQKPQMDGLKPGQKDDPTEPLAQRRARMDWAFAAMPSAVPGMENVTSADCDVLAIPSGAKHPQQAFEFMAYLTSQPVMEAFCNGQSKPSPLRVVSKEFLQHHINPYIDVFETLTASPNAHCVPRVPIWTEAQDEMNNAANRIVALTVTPEAALLEAQNRLQSHYDLYASRLKLRQALGK